MDYLDQREMRAAFAPYRDPNGFVQPRIYPDSAASQNGLLYTSEYYSLLALHCVSNEADRIEFESMVDKCSVLPGLLKRNHGPDQQGIDDYIGVLLAAMLLKSEKVIRNISDYGNKHFYFYNNVRPGSLLNEVGKLNLSACFFRFIPFVACLKVLAGEKTKLAWLANEILKRFEPTTQDGHILFNYQSMILNHRYLTLDHLRMGMKTAMLFRELNFNNKDHPLAVWGEKL
jgi:hypothetical protein